MVTRTTQSGEAWSTKAHTVGIGDHPNIKLADFILRVTSALAGSTDTPAKTRLLEEVTSLHCATIGPVVRLRELVELDRLAASGPEILSRDSQGRGIYAEISVEHKNQPSTLSIREDGLTFTGEVLLDIAWGDVVHVANTTHATGRGDDRIDYEAVAIQEGKRRTATKFALMERTAYAQALIAAAWRRHQV